MADLGITYEQLSKQVMRYLGMSSWDTDVTDPLVQAGYHQFLFPPPMQGIPAHTWSFLRPTSSLTLAAGTRTYDLPDDFSGMDGGFTFDDTDWQSPVLLVNESQIRKLYQGGSGTSSRPQRAAVRPKDPTHSAQQGYEVIFWPEPQSAYNLSYRYVLSPPRLDNASHTHPVGGAMHGQTILESCLAVAEQREYFGEEQIHWHQFRERLMASIDRDRMGMAPDNLGYNGDSEPAPAVRPYHRITGVSHEAE
jgi:hypothetical protein